MALFTRVGRLTFGLFLLAAAGLAWAAAWAGLDWRWAALAGATAATFLCYGYDKHQAVTRGRRVPEWVLHALTLLGGTVGAFLGMAVFRHKTRDRSFRRVFYLVLILQAGAVYCWWRWG